MEKNSIESGKRIRSYMRKIKLLIKSKEDKISMKSTMRVLPKKASQLHRRLVSRNAERLDEHYNRTPWIITVQIT